MDQLQKFSGVWQNQFGSQLRLEVDTHGRVLGKFQTKVGRPETRKHWENHWFDVVGFANGQLISVSVNFNYPDGAVYSVLGRLHLSIDGSEQIETITHTAFGTPNKDRWRGTAANLEIFHRESSL